MDRFPDALHRPNPTRPLPESRRIALPTAVDPAAHKRWTGVDPAPIHANLAWLKASGRPFVARIPLIPGVNDSDAAKEGFARLLEGPSGLLRVELLPYHLTAAAKYPFTGRAYEPGFDPTVPLNKETAAFERHGLPVVVM